MIRVLVADDHKIVREGIVHILEREQDISVVAQADNGRLAVELAKEHKPDVVLMDMSMPEMNGGEAARRITEELGDCRVLILSMHSDKRYVSRALASGAKGYMLKGSSPGELVTAIRNVAAGELYVCTKLVSTVVDNYVRQLQGKDSPSSPELSNREREVLQLIAEGNNTKEIALLLGISTKTVETFRRNLMTKLDLFNVASLTRYAVREGIITIDE